jgi:membrane-associated phospholipid phosphatase
VSTSELPTTTAVSSAGIRDVEPDHRWVVRLWSVVAAFAVVTVVRSLQVDIPLRDPHGSILVTRLGISLALFAVLALVDAGRRAGRRGWSVARVLVVLRERWPRRRLVLALTALLAYHLVYFCYHNLKSWDVLNRPRDTMLLQWDRWLFLGHSPAVLLHDLLGQHLAAYVLMVVYESFSTVLAVAVVAALVFPARIRDGYVFIAAGIWVWILGVGSYYLVPSLGPFHAAPHEFAGLPHTMIQDTQAKYLAQRAHLLANPQAHDAFAQVSAFASLHVALTSLLLLMARYYRLRRTTWLLAAFVTGTVVATVYLGWHFAVDDVAGAAIALAGVGLGVLTVHGARRTVRFSAGVGDDTRSTGNERGIP